jgi:hypothetical protein
VQKTKGWGTLGPDDFKESEWSGYFTGLAKGDLVFFEASDGEDGGMPFAVYDSKTQKKIFEDNAYYVWMWNKKLRPRPSPFNDIRVRATNDGNVVLTYLRVLGTECDIPNKGARVLATARPETRTEEHHRPQLHPLDGEPDSWVLSSGLPVETSLFPTPVTKTIGGPVRCWPAD